MTLALADPHACSAEACLAALDAAPEGLTSGEASQRLVVHGPNRLPEARSRGPILRFLAQFNNVLIYVLLGAALVTGALQHWVDTGVILAVVLANAMIGFIQEGKAEAAMAAIRGMLAPRAAVQRDGRRVTVPTLCPVTSCSSRRATRCPPTCESSKRGDWPHRKRS